MKLKKFTIFFHFPTFLSHHTFFVLLGFYLASCWHFVGFATPTGGLKPSVVAFANVNYNFNAKAEVLLLFPPSACRSVAPILAIKYVVWKMSACWILDGGSPSFMATASSTYLLHTLFPRHFTVQSTVQCPAFVRKLFTNATAIMQSFVAGKWKEIYMLASSAGASTLPTKKKKSQIDGAIEQIYIELCGCVCTSASDQCSNEPGQYSAGQRPSLLIVLEPDHGSTFCRPVLSDCMQLCYAYEWPETTLRMSAPDSASTPLHTSPSFHLFTHHRIALHCMALQCPSTHSEPLHVHVHVLICMYCISQHNGRNSSSIQLKWQ